MKKILLILLVFISCKTITKEEYLTRSCECIDNIKTTDKAELKTEIADCLSDHFVTYSKMATKEIDSYIKKNPTATRQEAQEYLVEMLHNELTEICPSYKEANLKLDGL